MCGIIGYVGKKNNVTDVLITGLKALEYRGYDSAGIALWNHDTFKLIKSKGKISNLEDKLRKESIAKPEMGIGHTRWATHGEPNDINSHPHRVGGVTLVHNGIIENYQELKDDLIEKGNEFITETDTEVVASLLNEITEQEKDHLKGLKKLTNKLRGSFALGIVFDDDKDHIYALRKDSPLILGVGEKENFIASDIPAIIKYTKDYILLEAGEIAKLSENKIEIFDDSLKPISKDVQKATWTIDQAEKGGYSHFMLKEIMEEEKVMKDTIHPFLNDKETLLKKMPDLSLYDQIHIVACGSAMHAGMIGKYLIETYGDIPVTIEVASEYRYKKNFYTKKTLVILVSQSGETADTIAALRLAKEHKVDTLSIVNVYGSTIARESDKVLYIYAGPEIAVATTKAYTLQVTMLALVALTIAIEKDKLTSSEIDELLEEFCNLPNKIRMILDNKDVYFKAATLLENCEDVFFLGRGVDYALSMEGNLKLKEISYIHSEAYQAGELKHGTISLIEKDTPVIALVTDAHLAEKTISNIKEVKARGAKVLLITTEELDQEYDCYNEKIVVPSVHPFLQPILVVPPLQLMSFEVARRRGCDIDKPRNLAKSVTVE